MKCNKCGRSESVESEEGNRSRDYVGDFDVISSVDEVVLVKKYYHYDCKSVGCNGGMRYARLELVPIDAVPTTTDI